MNLTAKFTQASKKKTLEVHRSVFSPLTRFVLCEKMQQRKYAWNGWIKGYSV